MMQQQPMLIKTHEKNVEQIENHLSYRLGTSHQLYLPVAKAPSLWSPLNTVQLSSPCSWSSRPAPSRRNANSLVSQLPNQFNGFDLDPYLLNLEVPVHVGVEERHGAGLADSEPVPGGSLDVDDPPASDVHQVVVVAD